jgi:putative ABC transport system ATP-binding protein
MEPVIRIDSLRKTFRTEHVETRAVDGVSLKVEAGEYVSITGPSGCGKSTLLYLLGLLYAPTSGDYVLRGRDVAGLSPDERSRTRNAELGFVFQAFNLLEELDVLENVKLPLQYRNGTSKADEDRAHELLERFGLAHRERHRPSQLSGGQQQRAAIARALVTRPPVVLLDEPTGNLDASSSEEVLSALDEINRQGTTVILVTHEPAYARRATTRYAMRDGKLVNGAGA